MRKIFSQILITLSMIVVAGCSAYDELPEHTPGSLQKRIKKSPDLQSGPARDQLAV